MLDNAPGLMQGRLVRRLGAILLQQPHPVNETTRELPIIK